MFQDCQLAHYFADVSYYAKLFSYFWLAFGIVGLCLTINPDDLYPKWVRILSIVTIIISSFVIILVPFPKTILLGC